MVSSAIITGLISIGKEFVEDKDKKNEFADKAMDRLLGTTTYKWVDALVKLSYASEQIIKGLFRPIGSMLLAGFAAYCSIKGIILPEAAQVLLFGAPVGWGLSRHTEKKNQKHDVPEGF